ncbi:hypothetical protein NE237_004062 [Protea cynaroides]|uniref:Uncharacterized protein n=1 Tax=Protea cynaroides TaxID=273540 RepID=A0A9Q0QT65_9MAGN|nr:hypothetical protein NE237_004062 [Protea cynaroides]
MAMQSMQVMEKPLHGRQRGSLTMDGVHGPSIVMTRMTSGLAGDDGGVQRQNGGFFPVTRFVGVGVQAIESRPILHGSLADMMRMTSGLVAGDNGAIVRPIAIDKKTRSSSLGYFARVCVDLDRTKPRNEEILVVITQVGEGKHSGSFCYGMDVGWGACDGGGVYSQGAQVKCLKCSKYDHFAINCRLVQETTMNPPATEGLLDGVQVMREEQNAQGVDKGIGRDDVAVARGLVKTTWVDVQGLESKQEPVDFGAEGVDVNEESLPASLEMVPLVVALIVKPQEMGLQAMQRPCIVVESATTAESPSSSSSRAMDCIIKVGWW